MTHSLTRDRYDVLVVGAGPSGLTTALAATRSGARVLVVDRHAGTTIFPKATGLRPRTMELMRTWGLEDEVRSGSQDLKVAGAIQSVLTGPVLQEFPIAAADPGMLSDEPDRVRRSPAGPPGAGAARAAARARRGGPVRGSR